MKSNVRKYLAGGVVAGALAVGAVMGFSAPAQADVHQDDPAVGVDVDLDDEPGDEVDADVDGVLDVDLDLDDLDLDVDLDLDHDGLLGLDVDL